MRKTAVLVALILLAAGAYSEEDKFTSFYDTELIKINYQSYGGLTLTYQGQSSGTMIGISPYIETLLSSYPDSKVSLESFKRKNSTGNILLYGGLGLILGAAYYPLLTTDFSNPEAYSGSNAYWDTYKKRSI